MAMQVMSRIGMQLFVSIRAAPKCSDCKNPTRSSVMLSISISIKIVSGSELQAAVDVLFELVDQILGNTSSVVFMKALGLGVRTILPSIL